jgi:hypothetical protein
LGTGLIFKYKAQSLPLKWSLLGQAPALPGNIILVLKELAGTNPPAYSASDLITAVKIFIVHVVDKQEPAGRPGIGYSTLEEAERIACTKCAK